LCLLEAAANRDNMKRGTAWLLTFGFHPCQKLH
jgi:hypothetical protein